MPKNKPPKLVPSVKDYVSAFRKIENELKPNQFKMLEKHYNCNCHITTATDLAFAMDYKNFNAANMQYGKLGSMVSNALGLGHLGVITLVLMLPPSDANSEWLWVMRDNVAEALEKLGWVTKTSHLFYPNGMVGPKMEVQRLDVK